MIKPKSKSEERRLRQQMDLHCWALGPVATDDTRMTVAFSMHNAPREAALEFANLICGKLGENVAVMKLDRCEHHFDEESEGHAIIITYQEPAHGSAASKDKTWN